MDVQNGTARLGAEKRKKESNHVKQKLSKLENKDSSSSTSNSNQDALIPKKHHMCPEMKNCGLRLTRPFFEKAWAELAIDLLGKRLVRKIGAETISGYIVETEAYLGFEDKAAHSYEGKRTERNEAMFMSPGTAYVYNIYGMYCCFNISSNGDGCAVLLRSLEPETGLALMQSCRQKRSQKKMKDKDLTNGPSKLCQALQINKDSCNKVDLTTSNELWLEDGKVVADAEIVKCPRINIGYAGEWVDKPLRFYIDKNPCVSVKYKPKK